MNRLKGTIAVFAVAAAFAGNAVAGSYECQNALGYQAWYNGGQVWNGGSGAWAATRDNFDSFKSKNTVTACVIPKNGSKKSTLGTVDTAYPVPATSDMTTDMCSVFTGLASASDKVAAGKLGDAYSTLMALSARLDTIRSASPTKLADPGFGLVKAAVDNATALCYGW